MNDQNFNNQDGGFFLEASSLGLSSFIATLMGIGGWMYYEHSKGNLTDNTMIQKMISYRLNIYNLLGCDYDANIGADNKSSIDKWINEHIDQNYLLKIGRLKEPMKTLFLNAYEVIKDEKKREKYNKLFLKYGYRCNVPNRKVNIDEVLKWKSRDIQKNIVEPAIRCKKETKEDVPEDKSVEVSRGIQEDMPEDIAGELVELSSRQQDYRGLTNPVGNPMSPSISNYSVPYSQQPPQPQPQPYPYQPAPQSQYNYSVKSSIASPEQGQGLTSAYTGLINTGQLSQSGSTPEYQNRQETYDGFMKQVNFYKDNIFILKNRIINMLSYIKEQIKVNPVYVEYYYPLLTIYENIEKLNNECLNLLQPEVYQIDTYKEQQLDRIIGNFNKYQLKYDEINEKINEKIKTLQGGGDLEFYLKYRQYKDKYKTLQKKIKS